MYLYTYICTQRYIQKHTLLIGQNYNTYTSRGKNDTRIKLHRDTRKILERFADEGRIVQQDDANYLNYAKSFRRRKLNDTETNVPHS